MSWDPMGQYGPASVFGGIGFHHRQMCVMRCCGMQGMLRWLG